MRVLLDTSVLVELERQREPSISLMEALEDKRPEFLLSTVTVAEILTGANLRKDLDQATRRARRLLGQFQWIEVDGAVASEAARFLAYLHLKGAPIEFQDVLIAATHHVTGSRWLVTLNEEHFRRIPTVADAVRTPEALLDEL